MENQMIVSVLPIGEFNLESVETEFQARSQVLRSLGIDPFIADPVSTIEDTEISIEQFAIQKPDIIFIIPLRGLSARAIEAAVLTSHTLCVIWPIQGRFALPSSTLAFGALNETGVPVELFYAPPKNPATPGRIQSILKAAKAYSGLLHGRIGIIGGLFPNLISCRYDTDRINSRLGTTFLTISFDEIREYMEPEFPLIQDFEQFRKEIVDKYLIDNDDLALIEKSIRLHMALKQLALKYQMDGYAAECWTGFPNELGLNPCMGFLEDAYLLACEGDVMVSLSQLIARSITGINTFVGDLFDLDMEGILTLVHCGAPASLALRNEDVRLINSQRAVQQGFKTLSCRPRLNPGLVTLLRFFGRDCDKMHVALGEFLTSESGLDFGVKIKLCGDRWDFLDHCFGNHYIVAPGDIRNELKLLCKWLKINIYET